ncbi:TolC family outer membrane protein [Morganella psychrotolerans]|uniref:TolC family outer membrane protein n=1 Tax=Morganella psychrotolerans TaxID=368603 RepID=A0A1B8HA60_9GAMM|nr:TolC family outer membrane protein [Morganella psychrotolerans]OBU05952.1 hypothetical protein AYY17_06360 [Morganella psychrotolerans]
MHYFSGAHFSGALCAAVLWLLTGAAQAITLSDLWLLALKSDPHFQAALKTHEADLAQADAGLAHLLPTAWLSYQNTPQNRLTKREPVAEQQTYRSHSLNVVVTQPLFDYAAYSQYKASLISRPAADSRRQQQLSELMVRVTKAYLALAYVQDKQALNRKQEVLHHAQLAAAQRLYQSGEGMLTDIQAQRTQLLLVQAQVADTEPEIEHARRTLADIIGQPQLRADDIARLNTGNFQPPALLPAEYPAWEQRALAENPQILAAQYDVSLAKQAAEVQRGAFMPTAQIFASWSDNKSDSNNMVNQRYESLSAGVHLSVPLFNGGKDMAGMRRVSAQYQTAQHERDAVVQTLLRELSRQYQICRGGRVKLLAYDQAVAAAQQQIQATQKSIAAGQGSQPEMLNARTQYYRVLNEQIKARYDWLEAWILLLQYSHTPDSDTVRQIEGYFSQQAAD